MASARCRDMERPRPDPPNLRVVELSAWMKGANRLLMRSAGMPMPVSCTEKSRFEDVPLSPVTLPPAGLDRHAAGPGHREAQGHCAALGEFDGVAQEIEQHLAQPRRITHEQPRRQRVHVHQQGEILLRGAQGHGVDGFFGHVEQVELDGLEFEAAGFDFREIQDVVDERQQRLAAGADDFRVFALLRIEGRIEHQAGHADHAIQGRADLVTHVGEELALRAVSPPRPLPLPTAAPPRLRVCR